MKLPSPGKAGSSRGARATRAAGGFLAVVCLGGALAAAVGWGWPLSLARSFLPHWGGLALVAAALCAAGRRWRLAALCGLVTLASLAVVLGVAIGRRPGNGARSGEIEVVSFNVRAGNQRLDRVAEWLASERADIVFLHEVGRRGLGAVLQSVGGRPGRVATVCRTRGLPFGSVVVAPADWAVERASFGPEGYPALTVAVPLGGRAATVLGTHVPSPQSRARWSARNLQLAEVARWARERPGPIAVVGDLNVTPIDGPFRALMEEGGLRSCGPVGWRQSTWPAALGPLGVEIDHALVSRGWVCGAARAEESLGSDHRRLRVRLSLAAAAPAGM